MWPFQPVKPKARPREEEPETLPESHVSRLERLEADMHAMRQEWGDTLDRISRHFSRVAARERQRIHRDLQTLESAEDAPQATNGESQGSNNHADAKARLRAAVNAQKLRRA